MSFSKFAFAIFYIGIFCSPLVYAKRGGASIKGSSSMSFGLSSVSAKQGDLNGVINRVASQTNISTKELTSAYEFWGQYLFRFDGTMFALAFRPSYFTTSQTGTGSDGSYDYKLSGFTLFPLLRLYPLESSFIRFFMQGGIGWGKLSTNVSQGPDSISFEGSDFGAMGGLGVDFCFTESSCLTIEGNARYLPIQRNVATTGPNSTMIGFSQTAKNMEVEVNSRDLDTTMSGIQGVIAYTYLF